MLECACDLHQNMYTREPHREHFRSACLCISSSCAGGGGEALDEEEALKKRSRLSTLPKLSSATTLSAARARAIGLFRWEASGAHNAPTALKEAV